MNSWLREDATVHVSPAGGDDVMVFTRLQDTWFSEDLEEVTFEYALNLLKERAAAGPSKRATRKKAAPKPKRTEPRGSRKPKVKKKGPGVAPRRK